MQTITSRVVWRRSSQGFRNVIVRRDGYVTGSFVFYILIRKFPKQAKEANTIQGVDDLENLNILLGDQRPFGPLILDGSQSMDPHCRTDAMDKITIRTSAA